MYLLITHQVPPTRHALCSSQYHPGLFPISQCAPPRCPPSTTQCAPPWCPPSTTVYTTPAPTRRPHLGVLRPPPGDGLTGVDGRPFSTYDSDHDAEPGANCAAAHGAGWWYDRCDTAALTASLGPAAVWTTPRHGQLTISASVMMVRGK